MKTALFDFDLPERLIALRPVSPRDSARLLVVHANGALEHDYVRNLPILLREHDILSINDSRVICARLTGTRPSRLPKAPAVAIEVTLHKREAAARFRAFAQPARRLRVGDQLHFP